MDIFGFHKGKNTSTISRLFRGPFCSWMSPTVALQTPKPATCTIKETENMPPYFRQSFASRQPSPCSSGGFLSVPRWRHYWLGGNISQADIRSQPCGGSVTPRATPSATQTNCLKKRPHICHSQQALVRFLFTLWTPSSSMVLFCFLFILWPTVTLCKQKHMELL